MLARPVLLLFLLRGLAAAEELVEPSESCKAINSRCSKDHGAAWDYCDSHTWTWTGTWTPPRCHQTTQHQHASTVTKLTTETDTTVSVVTVQEPPSTVTSTVHTTVTSTARTTTSVSGTTITTTTCGTGSSSTIAASITKRGKRGASTRPNCFAEVQNAEQVSSACACIGAPAHRTTSWWTAACWHTNSPVPPNQGHDTTVTRTVTDEATSLSTVTTANTDTITITETSTDSTTLTSVLTGAAVTVEMPLGIFQLQAIDPEAPEHNAGQYAQILGASGLTSGIIGFCKFSDPAVYLDDPDKCRFDRHRTDH